MILVKFQNGARPGTWWNWQSKFRYKSIINSCKNKVKTSNFKIFFTYTLCYWIFLLIEAIILRFFCQKWKICLSHDRNHWPTKFLLCPQFLYLTQIIQEHSAQMKKILKFEVLTLFLHELIMLLYRNFNCRFHHVPGLAHSETFPKSFPYFYRFLSEILKRN
jgi:hypothetical protein